MALPEPTRTPDAAPRDASASRPAAGAADAPASLSLPLPGITRVSPLVGGLLLSLVAAGAAAALAWGLAQALAPLGAAAPAIAAAVGLLVLVLPVSVLLVKLARQLERAQDLLARLDTLDMLTGVANRAHFLALAEREWARARRYGSGTGIVLVEIDRFRRLVDLRGSSAGDAVLRELAASVAPTLRGADALARYGPAQLAVLLAQADATGALDVAERIRERAEQLEVPWQDQRLRITVSTGVATVRPAHAQLSALMQDAEAALEASRQAGGNSVRAAPVDLSRPASSGVGDNQAAGPL